MSEITPDELYKGLLAHGLFSEKIPPIFTSEMFFDYCENMSGNFQDRACGFIYYENMRNINVPRPLGIPNPMAYQRLCKCLKQNWSALITHFEAQTKAQTHKVSRIHIRKMYRNPALFHMNYENWRIDGSPEIDISFGKRYMVKADISSCFSSIYTHAIPWALVTKDMAKAERTHSTWFNSIDFCIRRMKNDETHGLLIGPHASNLLAEIILTTIDKALEQWHYIRNIDDYICYVETYEEGQKFLTELGVALRFYGLSLNHKKTEICELPLATTDHWLRRLNATIVTTDYGKSDYKLVCAYLDHAIDLMHENKDNASILNYAIKVLASKELTPNAQEYCAKTVLNLSIMYPYLISILDEFVFGKYCTKCQTHKCIARYANIVYQNGNDRKNYEQVSYSIFFAIKYGFLIQGFKTSDAIKSDDCIYLMFAYLYAKKNKFKNEMDELQKHASALCADQESFDQYWLFIYEALTQTKLTGEWARMKKQKVTFIKPSSQW